MPETTDRKDLTYFAAHPDEMPEDPGAIEALLSDGVTEPGPAAEPASKPGDATQQDAGSPQQAEATTPEEKPVIATRDGQHVIPYDVLQTAREQAAIAREEKAKAEAELAALKAQIAEEQGKAGQQASDLESPNWEQLEEDLPEALVKTLRLLDQRANRATEILKEREQQEAAAHQATVQQAVRDAIDRNADLARWEAENAEQWEIAKAVDERLRGDSAWQDKSFDERFAEVVRVVKGEPAKPGKSEIDEKVDELMRKASAAPSVPRSISEIPGGAPPAQTDVEAVEQMSAVQLAEHVLGMSDAQLQQWLSRFG